MMSNISGTSRPQSSQSRTKSPSIGSIILHAHNPYTAIPVHQSLEPCATLHGQVEFLYNHNRTPRFFFPLAKPNSFVHHQLHFSVTQHAFGIVLWGICESTMFRNPKTIPTTITNPRIPNFPTHATPPPIEPIVFCKLHSRISYRFASFFRFFLLLESGPNNSGIFSRF